MNGLDHLSPFLEGRPPDAPMSLRRNPRHVLLPCEVATVVDGEVVALSRRYSAAAAGWAIATSTSVSENVGALPRSA